MKWSALLIGTFFGMLILSSCNEEEKEVTLPKASKENTWYWGYFEGEINSDKISLENGTFDRPIISDRKGIFVLKEGEAMPEGVNYMGTIIHYNDSSELRIALYDLDQGERLLSAFYDLSLNEDWMKVTVYANSSKKEVKATYVPSKENPLKVEVTEVLWLSKREPVIEVTLEGVLYNRENNEDTMIIKGSYGTR